MRISLMQCFRLLQRLVYILNKLIIFQLFSYHVRTVGIKICQLPSIKYYLEGERKHLSQTFVYIYIGEQNKFTFYLVEYMATQASN